MIDNKEIVTAEQIQQEAFAYRNSRILLTAVELDLFSVIEGQLITSDEVAQKLGTNPKATNRLMNALCAMGYLRKTKEKFHNAQHSSQFLVKGEEGYLSNLEHTSGLWETWSTLTEAVKAGTSVKSLHDGSSDDKWRKAFISAMNHFALKNAEILSYILDFSNVEKFFDVGGGSGAYSIEFCKKNINMTATIFDVPEVIKLTRQYVEKADLTDRISFVEGDYLVDEFPGSFDMIFISSVIHINSFEENKKLVKKCADILNAGGQLVIRDFVMKENRYEPYHAAIFALNMLVNTKNGDTYTESEIKSWMADAGLNDIELKETGLDSALVIGWKQ